MSAEFTQEHRLIALDKSPLGRDVLLLTAFSGQEEISRLFTFDLEFLSSREDIGALDMVGKNVTFSVVLGDGTKRRFNGFVNEFAAGSFRGHKHRVYYARVVPWLWFLTQTNDCRIFQHKTVPQIIEQIFKDLGFKDYDLKGVKGEHSTWDYRVQYRESDFNFVSRLMEQEGIFYWFRHTGDDRHILVLADHKSAYDQLPEADVDYVGGEAEALSAGHIFSWRHGYHFVPGRWTHRDFNFESPSANLHVTSQTALPIAECSKYERYDYPGSYQKRNDGEALCKLRIEEEEVRHDVIDGQSGCRGFQPGGKFKLTRHESAAEANKKYVITGVKHEAMSGTYGKVDDAGERYTNSFTCIPADTQYRPRLVTPIPVVQGPQTAIVVGPAGEEIHTDNHGRVKVQFHWDREGKKDDKSSCWVRVSHAWAGRNWGAISLPRIGQEVIVDFLEGDPDRPIITGRVYNAEQMPPYALPANMTQTGILTRSSKGGSGTNCNEIRFEDKKGEEQLYIHAEKNQDISVENDETHSVGHDRSKTVDHDETTLVKNNRTETVGGEESITVMRNRTRKVMLNETIGVMLTRTRFVGVNDLITVVAAQEIGVGGYRLVAVGAYQDVKIGAYLNEKIGADRTENVGSNRTSTVTANDSLTVKGGQTVSVAKDQGFTVDGGRSAKIGKDDTLNVGKNLVIDAGESITIKTGSASISMKKDGTIVIKGKDITVDGSGKINIKADSDVVIKGSKVLQN